MLKEEAGISSQQQQNNINTKTLGLKEKFKEIAVNNGLKIDDPIIADGTAREISDGCYIVFEASHPKKEKALFAAYGLFKTGKVLYYQSWPDKDPSLNKKEQKQLNGRIESFKCKAKERLSKYKNLNFENIQKTDNNKINFENKKSTESRNIKKKDKATLHLDTKADINNSINYADLEAACIQEMRDIGLVVDKFVVNNNEFNRIPTSNKPKKRNGWYIAASSISEKGNIFLMCSYGDNGNGGTDEKHCFKSWERADYKYNKEELVEIRKKYQKQKVQEEKLVKEKHDKAAKKAQEIHTNASGNAQLEVHCKYGDMKGIALLGVKFGTYKEHKNSREFASIIIPLRNKEGEIRTLQFIYINSSGEIKKRFLAGGEKRGNYFAFGDITDGATMYACEGYATGASVCEAIGSPVIVAIDAGNLEPVIANIKKQYPKSKIIVAGDDDGVDKYGKNKGKDAATAAAKKHDCEVVFPVFPEEKNKDINGKKYTDFNDLHQVCELKEVKRQLNENAKKVQIMVKTDIEIKLEEKIKAVSNREEELKEKWKKFSDGLVKDFLSVEKEGDQKLAALQKEVEANVIKKEHLCTVAELNKKHAVVGGRYLTETHDPVSAAKDFVIEKKEQILTRYENQFVKRKNDKNKIVVCSKANLWRTSPYRRTYAGIIFEPKANGNTKVGGEWYYNIWTGFSVKPKRGDCSKFWRHVKDNICNGSGELFEYLRKWLASVFQHPDKRHTAVVLCGSQGVGKNFFVEGVGLLLGAHFTSLNHPIQLVGQFNSHLKNRILIHVNEIFDFTELMKSSGKLKSMITDDRFRIEAKGKDSYEIKNCQHFILSSNEDMPVRLDHDDRRYVVLRVGEEQKNNRKYFGDIQLELEGGGREALLYDLLNEDLAAFDPTNRSYNEASFELKIQGATSIEKCLYYEILKGDYQRFKYCDYEGWHRSSNENSLINSKEEVGRMLKKIIPSIQKVRTNSDGRREYEYRILNSDTSKKEFQAFYDCKEEVWNE